VSTTPPGIIFDCMVFVQALANNEGPAAACMRQVDQGRFTLFISPAVLVEVREVLSRP
jgi:predicted nucleic acid-binding protein